MDDLRFDVLFNSISVISGRWADDNKRLCAMESSLRLKRSQLQASSLPTELQGLLKLEDKKFYNAAMNPKDAYRMANSVDPNHWVCSVCKDRLSHYNFYCVM